MRRNILIAMLRFNPKRFFFVVEGTPKRLERIKIENPDICIFIRYEPKTK